MADVFISYSRRDKDFVARLHEALRTRETETWVDWEDIPPSAEWFREIQDGIDAADAFLYVLTPDSATSEVCDRELAHALEGNKRVIPILRRDVDPARVRREAAALNWVYLRDEDAFEEGVEKLVAAIDTDLEHVRAHTHWSAAAAEWERAGRDSARLLRGSELEEAERWLTSAAGKQPEPTELQGELVQASREAARRRGRIIFGAVSAALVVAVVLAIVALVERSNAVHQSKVAFSRELDAQAQNQYDSDPELSVLLAARAATVAPGPASEDALRQALGRSHVRETYRSPMPGPVRKAEWSPVGDRLLIADPDGHARIMRPGTATRPVVLDAPGLTDQVAWDARGRRVITGAARPAVWDPATGRMIQRLGGRGALVATLSPAGDRAATVDLTGTARVWSVSSGRELVRFPSHGEAAQSCLLWSPDSRTVAQCGVKRPTGNSVGILRLWDPRSGHELHAIKAPFIVASAAFSPDGRRILVTAPGVSATGASTFLYDVRSGRLLASFTDAGSAAAYSPDGQQIAYATTTGLGHIYDLRTHRNRPLVGHTGRVDSIRYSRSGARLITGSVDDTGRVFDASTGAEQETLAGHRGALRDATFSADETRIATASDDGTARVWSSPVPRPDAAAQLPHDVVQSVGFSPDRQRVAEFGRKGSAMIADSRSLRVTARPSVPARGGFLGAGWSFDGRWLAALSGPLDPKGSPRADIAEVYDGVSGRLSATLSTPGSPIVTGAFSEANDHLATASANGEADEWDPADGRRLAHLSGSGGGQTVTYTKDGSLLAVAHGDDHIDIWRAGTGKLVRSLRGPAPVSQLPGGSLFAPISAAFSPDSRLLASAGAVSGTVQLWDVSTGRRIRDLRAGTTAFISLAFSPDSQTLIAGNAASAHIWRVPSGDYVRELKHADPSTYGGFAGGEIGVFPGFSKDGSTILTQGDFGLRAWNAASGQPLFDIFAVRGGLSLDGRRLVAVTAGQLKVYPCDLCGNLPDLLATARRETTRQLSAAERSTYLHER
jgi:WD40 repeat protein